MNINIKLSKNFTQQFNKLVDKYGPEMARLNGFAPEQMSLTDFIENFTDEDVVADASIDPSSNVARKDMVTLLNEMSKPHKKLLAYHKIFYEMQKKYGYQAACQALEDIWNGALYLHDADTSTYVSYCFAYDLKSLAEEGLWFISDFNNEPPKHLCTWIDFLKEFVAYFSCRTSGAVGLPNLIPYTYYFWKKDVENGYYTESPDKYLRQNFQRFIYALNQPFLRTTQCAFTNTSVFDRPYLTALFGSAQFPDGTDMIDELDGIMECQKVFMEVMADIRNKNMFTFPVSTISLLRKNGKFEDEEFAEWAIKHNMKWNDSNFFIDDSVSSLSNCCRLKSDIRELYFNSIGGSALKVGSVKVSTINLARIALEADTEKEFYIILKNRLEEDMQVLDVVRHILKRNCEKGLMPQFDDRALDFKHLYNTIGLNGLYEAIKAFGYCEVDEFGNTFYTQEADDFAKHIFEIVHNARKLFDLDKDYTTNVEYIPGESCADKFMKKDKILFGDKVIDDLPLYGNQFIPLGIQATAKERVRVAALYDGFCTGGSILHFNIDKPFESYEQAREMTEWIADSGVTYFAFNTKIQVCKNNHAFYGKKCPVCGNPVDGEFTRIVGFYTKVSTWSEKRQEEYAMREWEDTGKEHIDKVLQDGGEE